MRAINSVPLSLLVRTRTASRSPQRWPQLFSLVLCLLVYGTSALGIPNQNSKDHKIPNLETDLAPRVFGTKLNYRVAIGRKDAPLQIQQLYTQLNDKVMQSKRYSTGIYTASLLQEPFFINTKGQQNVDLQEGGWEVNWAPQSPHGHLVASFISPVEVTRNENDDNKDIKEDGSDNNEPPSILKEGRFYIYHRVWTKATLAYERDRRRAINSEAAKYLDDRDQKVKKIVNDQENLGTKVVSYAQAAKSMNEFRSLGVKEACFVPLYDDQVLELDSDLCILSSRGQVYTAENGKPEYIGESRVDFLKQ